MFSLYRCAVIITFATLSAFSVASAQTPRGRVSGVVRSSSGNALVAVRVTATLWLIFTELTLVRFAWTFNLAYDFAFPQVIWVIGFSMVVLAGLIYLPRWAVATFELTMIFGHNLLDGIEVSGSWSWLWAVAHAPAMLHPTAGMQLFAAYPLIPRIGVMTAGYALAPVFLQPEAGLSRELVVGVGIDPIHSSQIAVIQEEHLHHVKDVQALGHHSSNRLEQQICLKGAVNALTSRGTARGW